MNLKLNIFFKAALKCFERKKKYLLVSIYYKHSAFGFDTNITLITRMRRHQKLK